MNIDDLNNASEFLLNRIDEDRDRAFFIEDSRERSEKM